MNSSRLATAGGAADSIARSVNKPILDVNGKAVQLLSTGGRGGNGGLVLIGSNYPGAHGGAGGALSLNVAADIVGSTSDTTSTPLIFLDTLGGDGGYGRPSNNSDTGFGAGGAGGAITFGLSSSVKPTGDYGAGVYLLSQGGLAGGLPLDADRGTEDAYQATDAGGAGGNISVTIAASGQVSTDGKQAPALVLSSLGGEGGSSTVTAVKYWGSNGGAGGNIGITNNGLIRATGKESSAVVLESVGNKGGNGGGASIVSGSTSGSPGGDGGTITATNARTGTIQTAGDYGFALLAQSVGGTGGKGGDGTWWNGGGDGGAAGAGGTLDITNAGTIASIGASATAVMLQSVGGGYALNAFRSSETLASGGGGGAGGSAGWLSGGGEGGAGGAGGDVAFTNSGTIATTGSAAYGVLAQSVGGGGGTGGEDTTTSLLVAIALGGGGGSGGNGGGVTFTGTDGLIRTDGDQAVGVLAQSVGGGGGTGGEATASAASLILAVSSAIGGSGGKGGKGGAVDVENATSIVTTGQTATALQALSIGGGGGSGGGANALAVAAAMGINGVPIPSISYSNAIGGSGGSGGSGDAVTVSNGAIIRTLGTGSGGIQAQSIGGGGGNAGNALAYSLAVGVAGSPSISVSDAIGGSGGSGGLGGTVTLGNAGTVSTSGDSAVGLQALSIGGGGGVSGAADTTANALSTTLNVTVSVGVGGSGGNGGSGGAVSIENSGTIDTSGSSSMGVVAQSIGGGGGNSGAVSTTGATGLSFDAVLNGIVQFLPLAKGLSVAATIGGDGGDGGNGGSVSATMAKTSAISTTGSGASGIFAQSVGGGGGTVGAVSTAATNTVGVNLSFGGDGGSGGTGGAVTLSNAGTISTQGDSAHGMFAQSVGGGGGAGGTMSSDSKIKLDTVSKVWAALKTAVGTENFDAWMTATGNTETKDALNQFIEDVQDTKNYPALAAAFKASDFVSQVLTLENAVNDYLDRAGKGENSTSYVNFTLAMGGDAGSGATADAVEVSNSGTIATTGDMAHGFLAQSIGGGGGQGGVATTSGASKVNLSVTLGGDGGSGGTGGTVDATNSGAISTTGEAAFGMFAQSVGGGGGIGVGSSNSSVKTVVLNLTIGGDGASGADGGNVTVTNSGTIATTGSEAHGIVAQSVGGGGGGFAMNPQSKTEEGTQTDETVSSETITALLKAAGMKEIPKAVIDASDDKAATVSGSLSFGGDGGGGGDAGSVKVTHSGAMSTTGEGAFGIFAQSVGGGGGLASDPGDPGHIKYSLSFGGSDGIVGNGGNVTVFLGNGSSIGTTGDYASAVVAQSVGGGGGYGSKQVLAGNALAVIGSLDGKAAGNGGAVGIGMSSRNAAMAISTTGDNAHGILAQSLGGGGSLISLPFQSNDTLTSNLSTLSTTLSDLVSRSGGSSTIADNMDKIPSSLRGYISLFASTSDTLSTAVSNLTKLSSNSSNSSGTGGAIDVTVTGTIQATGSGSYGIFAQSGRQLLNGALDETVAGGDINVTFAGDLSAGSGTAAAIGIDGGKANTLVIQKGSNVSALSGLAVRGSFGTEYLNNYGTLTGDVILTNAKGKDSNTFKNYGTYRTSGTTSNMVLGHSGARGNFFNSGTLDIAGVGKIGTLNVVDTLVDLKGTLLVDVSSSGSGSNTADMLVANSAISNTGKLVITPNVVDSLVAQTTTIVSGSRFSTTERNGTYADITVQSSSIPITWSVSADARNLMITPSADFVNSATGTLTPTETNALSALQMAWDATATASPSSSAGNKTRSGTVSASGSAASSIGVSGLFADMANVTSQSEYARTIDSLAVSESVGLSATVQTFVSARTSMGAALSCPAFEGDGTLVREAQCVWANVTGNRMTQDTSRRGEGFTQSSISYRMGGQWEFLPNWFLGVTAGYNDSSLNSSDKWDSVSGHSGDLSVALKHQMGPWMVGATLHGGYGTYDSRNNLRIGTNQWIAEDDNDIWTGGIRLRVGYEFAFKDWYVTPYVDMDALYTSMTPYDFDGPGLSLRADAVRQWSFAVEPALEFGSRINVGENSWLRLFATVGGSFLSEDGIDTTVWMSDGRGTGVPFVSASNLPSKMLNLGGGLQFLSDGKYEIRGDYKAQIADDFLNQELGVSASLRF